MDTDIDSSTTRGVAYHLQCVDCSFEMTVEGDVSDVYDVIEGHQGEHPTDSLEHFVEFAISGSVREPAD